MGKYILKRLLWMIVIVLGTAFIIFTILYFTPGDPAVVIAGGNASASDIALMRTKMGIDRPYPAQLGSYFYNTFIRMDFGNSWVYDKPVYQEMLVRLPRTILIGVSAMVLNLGLGLYLGIFAATHEGRWQDSLTMAIAMIFISCPDFWVALMMILLFSAKLGWLPSYGIGGPQYYVCLLYTSPGGVAIYRVSDIFDTVYFSDGVPALTGYTVEEYQGMIRQDAAEMTYKEDTAMVVSRALQVVQSKGCLLYTSSSRAGTFYR